MAYTKTVGGANLYNLAKRNGVAMRTLSKYGTLFNINAGLVVWWKLDETTGSTATDSSGNGKTGTLYNMENDDWVAGEINNCLSFGGTDEYAANADIGSLSGDLTVSLWMKRNGVPAINERMFDLAQAALPGLNIVAEVTTGYLKLDNEGGSDTEQTIATNICNNAWHHIVLTRTIADPVTFKIYLDGALVLTDNTGNSGSTLTRLFIAQKSIGDSPYTGLLDDVRVYNRAFSADDVTALYAVTAPA